MHEGKLIWTGLDATAVAGADAYQRQGQEGMAPPSLIRYMCLQAWESTAAA